MVPKRQIGVGGEEASDHSNKRRRLFSILRGANNARTMQETVSSLEPLIRRWVKESVEDSFGRLLRSSNNHIECSGSRTLQLKFLNNLPKTLFTGGRILSDDRSPIRIALYDSSSNDIVASGSLSSSKVTIVVLDSDFGSDDLEDWSKTDFDRKIVNNREGRRPLITGELTVILQNGVGCIGDVSFTDNSSWIRSGKFRMGAKVHTNCGEVNIREGMSNAFKVKDHRGESYQKHYPPFLEDEVWRLEKIAKDGASHRKLTDASIHCVRDFLRLYFKDQFALRDIIGTMSNKIWETIMKHALTCTLDDEKYMYKAAHGMVLFFNTVHKLVGVTFDGQSYHSMDNLNVFQTKLVESQKQHAYRKTGEWALVCDQPTIGYPMLLPSLSPIDFNAPSNLFIQDANFQVEQDQLGIHTNTHQPAISQSYTYDVEQDSGGSYEIGESSHRGQGFDPAYGNSYVMSDSPGGFFMGNFIGTNLSTDDLPVDDNFQVGSLSTWQGNGLFLGSTNHEIGILSSNTGILIPRNGSPKTRWCKILAVVKWRILVRHNVAARKWKQSAYYNYF